MCYNSIMHALLFKIIIYNCTADSKKKNKNCNLNLQEDSSYGKEHRARVFYCKRY